MTVEREILLWSTASGLLLGLFVGATLTGLGMIVGAVVPTLPARVGPRLMAVALGLCFVVLPVAGGVLGFLEGRLKAG